MEAAIATEVFVSKVGMYRGVGMMAIWPDSFWSRLQLFRGLPGRGRDHTNATDCGSESLNLV